MYIADCNKDLIFFSAFVDLQSIRADEATTQRSSFSLMLWQMLWLLHWKHELKLQTLGKQWRSMKVSELFRKYPKTPVFDHSNYRLFERITEVPGTSNNRGLTVFLSVLYLYLSMTKKTTSAWYYENSTAYRFPHLELKGINWGSILDSHYNINVLQQTACLVVNPITVGNFAFLFNFTPVGQTSDSTMVPT